MSDVEARRNPAYLKQLIQEVEDFERAYRGWLTHHLITDSEKLIPGVVPGVSPAVMRRDGADPALVEAAAEKVGHAAGRIAHVAPMTGVMIGVAGVGQVDPFVNALYVSRPKPVLEPRDVLGACASARGRLEGLLGLAEADSPPTVDPASLHPIVWGAAGALWRDGYRRRAVSAAAEALTAAVKARLDRYDASDTAIWQESLSNNPPAGGKARLRWPGDPTNLTVKSIQDGLRQFAPGAQMLIRNPATHLDEEPAEQVALEQLCTLSLLARMVDSCILDEAPEPESTG
ncbi:hypothetical protein GCM10009836_45550 [Pseudonocardia ailaonensis]|uniref:Conserved hypothetical protein CHP02391 domain-containing protein n=1 Tax=Pseudonocardia ailaonensis TaxID=367279 RepID=A0ABN2NBP2_9PSEU